MNSHNMTVLLHKLFVLAEVCLYNPSMHIVSYMAHTKICHIKIKGVLERILCLWWGKVTVESNPF